MHREGPRTLEHRPVRLRGIREIRSARSTVQMANWEEMKEYGILKTLTWILNTLTMRGVDLITAVSLGTCGR